MMSLPPEILIDEIILILLHAIQVSMASNTSFMIIKPHCKFRFLVFATYLEGYSSFRLTSLPESTPPTLQLLLSKTEPGLWRSLLAYSFSSLSEKSRMFNSS